MKSHEEKIKTVWPEWDVIRRIGHGSFGAVYEIKRIQFGKTEKAAVKVLTIPYDRSIIDELYSEGYDDASISKRMHGELQNIVNEYYLMAELKGHTNIVNCDDMQYVEHEEGIGWDVFIKMELLTPLSKVFGKGNKGNVSDESVIKLGKDICQALTLCEKKNIVHRDIKPQNIFRSEFGEYKLGDFGIAKTMEHTTSGTKTGTYKYMAPEVYSNKPYGHSADIYSLGLVLYWLLNEKRMPFIPLTSSVPTSKMEDEARSKRFEGEEFSAPKNGSPALKKIVLKACAFKPKDRFATAQEMLNALKKLSGEKEDVHNMAYEDDIEYDHTAGDTAGSSFSGTRTERDPDYSFSSEDESMMGNSWEDTQGTMGNPGDKMRKESAEYDKTVGKQKEYEKKTHQRKEQEIEPEVTVASQKTESQKEDGGVGVAFLAYLIVTVFLAFSIPGNIGWIKRAHENPNMYNRDFMLDKSILELVLVFWMLFGLFSFIAYIREFHKKTTGGIVIFVCICACCGSVMEEVFIGSPSVSGMICLVLGLMLFCYIIHAIKKDLKKEEIIS